MATFAHTIEIERPAEEVFAFVSEPSLYPRSQPSLVRVEPHDRGPLRLGSEATEVRRFLGRGGTFTLEPCVAGTRFTWTVELSGPAACLGGPLAGRTTRSAVHANSSALQALLEEGA